MSNSVVSNLNRSHKDAVFKIVFNNPKELLSLYNALADRNIIDESQLIINTLESAVFIGINNDLSFIIDDCLSLYEHQSTRNPNMPLRGLFYFADLYKSIYYSDDIFTNHLIPLLTPKFVVFYNGREDLPDSYEIKLSEAFINKSSVSDLEVIAHVYNINEGHNSELADKCQKLKEYSRFISLIRASLDDESLIDKKSAVLTVINDCIEAGILSEILKKERNRIMETILSQFDAEKYIEFERAHSFDDGVDAGIESINKLNSLLIDDNRIDDLTKATNDPLFQKILIEEYKLN